MSELRREIKERIQPYDHDKIEDPRGVVEYADGIHNLLLNHEHRSWSFYDYMSKTQNEITGEHRRILINFFVYFHYAGRVKDDKTLFLAVQILDRFLKKAKVTGRNFQLVGCAAMLIAEKYEEIYPNANETFVKFSANAFDKASLQKAEREICKSLGFAFEPYPTPFVFLQRFNEIVHLSKPQFGFANMLLQLMLHIYDGLRIKPSIQAVAAIVISQQLDFDSSSGNEDRMHSFGSFDLPMIRILLKGGHDKSDEVISDEIKEATYTILAYLQKAVKDQSKFKYVMKKFSLNKFCNVAKWLCKPDSSE